MNRREFEELELNSVVTLINGKDVRAKFIDEESGTFMDHTGAWHHYTEAESPAYGD